MSETTYLPFCQGGRWAISREISGVWVYLIQDTPPDNPVHVEQVLRALGFEPTPENINRYFPQGKCTENRCPTLELLELFAHLANTRHEHGV